MRLKKFLKKHKKDVKILKSYKTLKKLNFIEFPKIGLNKLSKITKKIYQSGVVCYDRLRYTKSSNNDTCNQL